MAPSGSAGPTPRGRPAAPWTVVRRVSGWSKRRKLAHAFLRETWEYSYKKAGVGPTSGPAWSLSHLWRWRGASRATAPRPPARAAPSGAARVGCPSSRRRPLFSCAESSPPSPSPRRTAACKRERCLVGPKDASWHMQSGEIKENHSLQSCTKNQPLNF